MGAQYYLVETPSVNYLQRTEWNARDSDCTVVFTLAGDVNVRLKCFVLSAALAGDDCFNHPF
jgi:hypothetical protein